MNNINYRVRFRPEAGWLILLLRLWEAPLAGFPPIVTAVGAMTLIEALWRQTWGKTLVSVVLCPQRGEGHAMGLACASEPPPFVQRCRARGERDIFAVASAHAQGELTSSFTKLASGALYVRLLGHGGVADRSPGPTFRGLIAQRRGP